MAKHQLWAEELNTLRDVLIGSELDESVKWGMPTYSLAGKNVVSIGAFKNHVTLWFFNGALLKDKASVLSNAQDGKTQAMRSWKFERSDRLNRSLIKSYVMEAIQNEKEGRRVKLVSPPAEMPAILGEAISSNKKLKEAFEQLSPGKQKEYKNYIGEAKREDTQNKRLEKSMSLILEGKGLNDKYRR